MMKIIRKMLALMKIQMKPMDMHLPRVAHDTYLCI